MSRKEDYLARASNAAALADIAHDPSSRSSLKQAAESWRLLARMEDPPPPRARLPRLEPRRL